MKRFLMCAIFLSVLGSSSALADADLAKSRNCMACHSVQAKLVGPAFKDVAAKYAGQEDARNKLVQTVLKGGKGNWGPLPMPANPQLSETEAQSLVKWVLAQQ